MIWYFVISILYFVFCFLYFDLILTATRDDSFNWNHFLSLLCPHIHLKGVGILLQVFGIWFQVFGILILF